MSVSGWIQKRFAKKGPSDAEKIAVLDKRRSAWSKQVDKFQGEVTQLEKKEERLNEDGKAAASKVTKRRLASEISRSRKEISRRNTSITMLNKQINIVSTHIHNLELAQTGACIKMPPEEELTTAVVAAEEIMENLTVADDLANNLDTLTDSGVSADEQAILDEWEMEKVEKAEESPHKDLAEATSSVASETLESGFPKVITSE